MRNLLRSRRGSVAFATVVALVPLIGALALGGEAGSWYVTKKHAQNAADAAAYSGGVQQACLNSPPCAVSNTVDYRAKQFAAQHSFCNGGDTTAYPGARCLGSLPTGTTQTVQIASLTSWPGASGTNFVQATVSQQQPTYLAKVLGISTVTIGATAVAAVQGLPKPPCALSLTTISFQGSPNINAPNCGMAANGTTASALNFTGGGMSMNLGSLSAAGGCTGASQFCNSASTYMPPVNNPFSALDAVTLPTLANCAGSNLVAYTAAAPCKNNNVSLTGNADITLPGGVYFISGKLEIKGNGSLLGTALFILLPGASFSMKGGGRIDVTGNPSVATSQLPSVLQPYASLFANMAIYDQSNVDVTIGGNSQIAFKGNMYLPNAAVTFQGNPTISLSGGGCGELIAKSIAFNGNATFDSTGCSSATKLPSTQYVTLVQ